MRRDIEKQLLQWKDQKNRMPLLLRGARQVGKTYIIEKFGKENFEKLVVINFELQPEMIGCFESLDPIEIINAILLVKNEEIIAGKTLLFLDEIQDCPNAIRALRYFKERYPQLHVIGAGSLLEFILNDAEFRMPVGRVQSLYLKPLSFKEFLSGYNEDKLRTYVETIDLTTKVPDLVHEKLLKRLREYMILGGMPAVLNSYYVTEGFNECQQIQTILLNSYRQDFGKYAKRTDHRYLQRLYERIPGLIGDNFKYSKVDGDVKSRDIKAALFMLQNAGITYPVYCTSASGVPLMSFVNEKKFKVLFLDIGLVTRSGKLDAEVLLKKDLLLANQGMLTEQFVGQELLAYDEPFEESKLYFWTREQPSSTAEVDFVTTVGAHIIPIEVKSGTTGRLKSLRLFMQEKKSSFGVRLSQQSIDYSDGIISLPLYMVGEIKRIIEKQIKEQKAWA